MSGPDKSLASVALESTKQRLYGREAELKLIAEAVRADGRPAQVLILEGEPGVGKSALAVHAHLLAQVERRHSVFLTAQQMPPTAPGLRKTLRELGLDKGFADLGHSDRRGVLIVDGFEHIQPLMERFFVDLVAEAGANLTVILTSRVAIEPASTGLDAALSFIRHRVTRLSRKASESFLEAHDVAVAHWERAYRLTQGHPLSLQLLIAHPEWAAQSDEELPAELIRRLVERYLSDARSAEEREAIASLVLPRACSEGVLRCMLQREVRRDYEYLRKLSYVSETARGLVPHDLVRELVFEHFRKTDGQLLRQLGRNAVDYYLQEMASLGPVEQRQYFADGVYALRTDPAVGAPFGGELLWSSYIDEVTEEDEAWAQGEIRRVEGDRSAHAHQWALREARSASFVVRDNGPEPVGYQHAFSIDRSVSALDDPVAVHALELASKLGEPRGQDVWVCRWWLARSTYLGFGPELSALISAGPLVSATRQLPELIVVVTHDVERWEGLAEHSPLNLVGQLARDDRRYGFWLFELPAERAPQAMPFWLGLMASGQSPNPSTTPTPAFQPQSLKAALSAFHVPHRFEELELVQRLEGPEAATKARSWLLAGIAQMAESPAYADLASVLEATYIKPSAKQRAAAAELNLPWGTYRHRLQRALIVLTEVLQRTPPR